MSRQITGRDRADAVTARHRVSMARVLKGLAVVALVVFMFSPVQTQRETAEQIVVLFGQLWALVEQIAAGLTEMR